VRWDEVEACAHADDLVFTAGQVLERTAQYGDLFAPLLA
jgi:bifunctional non-homologous end joining protein LigD